MIAGKILVRDRKKEGANVDETPARKHYKAALKAAKPARQWAKP
jgi:hypothetical protein